MLFLSLPGFFSCSSLITFCQHCTSGVESGWGRAQALDGSFVKILYFIKCQSVLYLSVKFQVDRPGNLSHCVIILTCPIECLWGRVFFLRRSILLLLLYYVHGKHLRPYRSVNLTTLFLGRLRPPKWLTSTSCTYFHQ